MGASDGAEVCEAIDNFLLYQNSKNLNKKDIGLYRDYGLVIFKRVSVSKAEKIKNDIQKLFKGNQTIHNLKIGNYLDVTFNLSNATYQPFCKPNNEIIYIIYITVKKTTYLDEKYFRLTSLSIYFIYIHFIYIYGIKPPTIYFRANTPIYRISSF